MVKTAVLIDSGHLRVVLPGAGYTFNPENIERIAHASLVDGEALLRVLFYDCAPFTGTVKLPVSQRKKTFIGSDGWLNALARKDYFAVRLGVLKFRGWLAKPPSGNGEGLSDKDFRPNFEQKGVDMRIGLDIAHFCAERSAERLVVITNDTDLLPALKYARRSGLQIAIVQFPRKKLATELTHHADFVRKIAWPDDLEPETTSEN